MIVLMEMIVIIGALLLVGLCMGSFAGAMVWRLRARQLVDDKAAGEKIDASELKRLKPLVAQGLTTDRSRCLHCGHTLNWYDLLPLVSWVSTGGKCRYCHEKIGVFEPLIEIGTALFFIGSFIFWPESLQTATHITSFVLWLIAGVMLAILFAYDARWFLLPNRVVFPLIALSVVMAIIHVVTSTDVASALFSVLMAAAILSGVYFLLWIISKGRWIGFGDVKLGLALALMLADWRLAFLALFAANVVGCLIVIPGMLAGKITRKTHVPFGPLLICGCVIAGLFGDRILSWYFSMFL